MKTIRLLLACAAIATLNLQLSTAFAQGTAFSYQGVLSQSGATVNGSNDLTFTLYDAASGGNTVGTSNVVNDLVMSNGLFTVTLDFGASAVNGSPRWLQIAARPGASTGAYTNLAPRQPITSTPYAIYASGANASGLSGTISGSQIAPGAINTTHIASTVSFWDKSGSTISYTGGSVGIGTASPATRLHVSGDGFTDNGRLTVETTGGNFGPQLRLKKGGSGGEEWVFVANGPFNGPVGDLNIVQQGTGQARFTITTAGNVGIGTATPQTPLHVNSPTYGFPAAQFEVANCGAPCAQTDFQEAIRLWNQNNNGQVGIGFTVGGGSFASNAVPSVWLGTGYGDYGNSGSANDFKISTRTGTSLNDRIYLNGTTGNLGIGKNNPGTKLDVAGDVTCVALNITSDRNAKEQFKPVNTRDVLDKVAAMPITEWQYKQQADSRHIGPMAQDFRDAFTLGQDEKHISVVDEGGVALAAIQGLNQKVDEKDARIKELEKSVIELKQLVEKLAASHTGGGQ